ncbi:hypothetical protein [Microbacterium sp.]|uniref:hypothetical protein n=1 Tax=Microbacterium sp. TaxID=51671 RepID=UPI003A872735
MTGRALLAVERIADVAGGPVGMERALAADMTPARRREFCAGRVLARRSLARIGVSPPEGIGWTASGAPRWPNGATGSISHSSGTVAVIVDAAPARWGIDIEPVGAVRADVALALCAPGELNTLAHALGRAPDDPCVWAMLHTAKESAYKAQDAAGAWRPRESRVDAVAVAPRAGRVRVAGAATARGRWWIREGLLCVVLRAEEMR